MSEKIPKPAAVVRLLAMSKQAKVMSERFKANEPTIAKHLKKISISLEDVAVEMRLSLWRDEG